MYVLSVQYSCAVKSVFLLWWESLFSTVNTLSLYSLGPYRQTDGRTEKQIHSLRVGWRNDFSFPVVLLCQFFVLAVNRLWFYILLMYLGVLYHKVVVLC